MPADGSVTDFSGYTLVQLNQMLDQSNPASCRNAAQAWGSVGNLVYEQAGNLESRLRSVAAAWSGTASAEYKQMMTALISGMRRVAETAFQMRDVMYYALDALNTARAELPAPVDMPAVSPASLAVATTPFRIGPNTPPHVAAQLQQRHTTAVQAVQRQQRAAAAASAAHAQAITVMQELAGCYVAAQDAIPLSPAAAGLAVAASAQPAAPARASAAAALSGSSGSPATAQLSAAARSGTATAAAAAAAAGRFGSLMPALPAFARPQLGLTGDARPAADASRLGAGTVPAVRGAAVRGMAAAAAGGWPGTAVGGTGAQPTAGPGMGGADPGPVASPAGGNAGGAAASSVSGSETTMPVMPMSGLAGAGLRNAGGSRRNPSWLVETQDVWGESFPAAPGLIG